ncbi:MAG: transcription termination factor Rho [Clostridiales bacterium]|nr:transcription termination factor Rho [Clostridiales bacterium]MBP3809802.1 transcription termination factor Rho [Clostridiales bacterium]
MSELDALMSKSKEDLEAIAAQFGDYTPSVAKTKSREELIASITRMSVREVQDVMEKAAAPAKEEAPAPVAEKTEENAPEASQKEEKPAAKKRAPRKKKTEEKVEEKSEEKAEEKDASSEEKPAPKKRGRKPKKKEEEAAPEQITIEEAAPEATAAAEEATAETPAQAEEKKEEAPAAEAQKETSKKPEKRGRQKRRIAFGPETKAHEVEISPEEKAAEEQAEATAEEKPQQPEVQYIEIEGILEIGSGDNKNDFNGFIHKNNYLPGEEDAYVPGQVIRRLGLRKGDKIKGLAVAPRGKDRYAPLRKVLAVNDIEIPEDSDYEITRKRPRFENLTAIYPDSRLKLETNKEDLSCRIIDLFCPIGKGQRGMIVSPPKAGKTVLLKKVANAITTNNPECKVIVLLIDERPEEVTDMQRSIKGEVVYSTFDKRPENHVRVTELVLERAMRLVELGQDVVILLDSMTRLARAYNLTINPTGRTLSGGLDPGSLYGPKRFFGAARNIEFGGSLTIIASALIETGSRMDEVIFEEFKGTGNMEVVLDRKLADRRVYPAIAVDKSGTRREDLLLTEEQLSSVWLTRKAIADVDTIAGTEAVLNFLKRTPDNATFVLSAQKSFSVD